MSIISLNLQQPEIKAVAQNQPTVVLSDADSWTDEFMSLKTASGKAVTRERAMRCSGVLSCLRILSEDISSLALKLKRKSPNGATDAVDHPLYRMLESSPNEFQTSLEVREQMMLDLLLSGLFFNWIPRNGAGVIQGIYPIPSYSMRFQGQQRNGDLVWSCGQPGFPTTLTHHELWRGSVLNHNFVGGHSLMLLAREAIGLLMAAEEQGARLFSNGTQTDMILSSPEAVDEPTKDQMRKSFTDRHAGSERAFIPMLLEGGMTATRIGLTAVESQYIEARHYQLADIARLARIPGVLLGLTDKSSTYASAEQFFGAYVKHTIMPWAIRIEQTISRDLILPNIAADKGLFAKHQLSSLLRADQGTRFAAYNTAITAGFMQPAEARSEEEWDEIDGLDVTWMPMNYEVFGKPRIAPPNATATPAPAPGRSLDEGDIAPQPPANPKGRDLSELIASSILRSENREFARMGRKAAVSETKQAGFAAWLTDKVAELTGCSAASARLYADWRFDNQAAEDEARTKIKNLCLEGAM